ncbi:9129_t:CDS:2 [Ambispora gerdemannii]|uniref:9129_t:CDS:1 n=1 Tax=Ambispora gerdemannii TaxID=144530 RepID=A0A9N9GIW1_9GLOM|nr:9129_t:CDS:2 [Ambispora gerdemannii]
MEINKIRNFSIIAHIDHGKSTLADRLLEKTNLKNSDKSLERALDSLSLEQEKGITIKLNAVQLYYPPESSEPYIFNLIDTPGHVDFMYEVFRSLAACEGVILLVDATKGIQAQTLAYYEIAKNLNLRVLPVINKIDLPSAQLTTTQNQLIELLDCQTSDIVLISAKTGQNVDLLLEKIITDIPSPLARKNNISEREEFTAGGIKILFSGKANAQQVARRVKPRTLKEIAELSIAMVTLYQYHGKVDLIITDPPYNTGKDFRYNDKWDEDPNDGEITELIKEEDSSKHTK